MNTTVLVGEKHLTASILLVTKGSPKRVLLVHHKKLNVWLQPGGHVEQLENPIEAVVRETSEETGIDIGFLLLDIKRIDEMANLLPVPRFFLEEKIPAHKDQPVHFHLDMFYLVEVVHQEIKMIKRESNDIRWFTLEEALSVQIFENTKVLLRQVLV